MQQVEAGLNAVESQVFVRLMGLLNVAGSQHDGVHADFLQPGRLGAKSDRANAVPGQSFCRFNQITFRRAQKRGRAGEQGC